MNVIRTRNSPSSCQSPPGHTFEIDARRRKGAARQPRRTRRTPERAAIRQQTSTLILEALRHDLLRLRLHASILPKSPLGRAIDYTLGLWSKLELFLRHGEVMIDNNPIENAIRPTAVGKKNWLFVGGEDTGERSAVIYTLIESAKRRGHEPYAYLKDLLERLPGMKTTDDLDALLPANWRPAGEPTVPLLAAS